MMERLLLSMIKDMAVLMSRYVQQLHVPYISHPKNASVLNRLHLKE
nr:MAG TPA: hypothetical protein [Caudoviricetes sp.]